VTDILQDSVAAHFTCSVCFMILQPIYCRVLQ